MGAQEGGVLGGGGEFVKDVNLDKLSSCVPSKLLDGGAESGTCGICSIIVHTRGLLDCCNHLFCFSCITEWFTVSNLCPLCKSRSRFITPQMLCGTGRWEKLEIGSDSANRDEGPSDEDGQPVSFPPYFIDEEAVLCLEGDSCLVRSGLSDLDAEGNAASDTSVACDLCDCWYHGGCVNFQPNQTSFVCPRCLSSKEVNVVTIDAPNLPTALSREVSSTTSSPPETQSDRAHRPMFGSASVAVEEPEEGESHISISLRRIPDVQPAKSQFSVEAQDSIIAAETEIMWSPIREPYMVPKYGTGWTPVPEPSREPKPLPERFLSSIREPIRKVLCFEEELWSPTREPAVKVLPRQEELWSPTRETNKDLSFVGSRSTLPAASANGFGAANPQRPESRGVLNPDGPRAAVSPRPEILNSSAGNETLSAIVSKTGTGSDVWRRLLQLNTAESTAYPRALIKEEISIDVERLQVAVEQLRKGKRKVLQGDERNIDVGDLPEMPRKIARKSTKKVDAVDEGVPVVRKDLVEKGTTDQIMGKMCVETVNLLDSAKKVEALDDTNSIASKVEKRTGADVSASRVEKKPAADVVENIEEKKMVADVVANKEKTTMRTHIAEQLITASHPEAVRDSVAKTESTEVSRQEQRAGCRSECLSAPENMERTDPEIGSEVDVMDIVRDTHLVRDASDTRSPSKGVRTRIIMHREQDMKDSSRPCLVERIRQQMRDSAGYGAGDDLGNVEVSDDRFIAAFKAAQSRSYEKSNEVKSVSSKAQSLGRLWKVLDKKYSARGARDNLIRKLYAGGGRKCWDRDWDIAFWRERDPNLRRARKEAEGGADGSGKDAGVNDMQPDSEDVEFFRRLYVADTSLFPRNEDLKPISLQGNPGKGTFATEPERDRAGIIPQRDLDKVSHSTRVKESSEQCTAVQGLLGASSGTDKIVKVSKGVDPLRFKSVKKSVKPSAVFMEKSVNGSASASSCEPQGTNSAALKSRGKDTEATARPSDVKKDKRQWALEVLARKEGKLSAPFPSARTGKGCSASKDNPFPFLLQLPVEMRPLILGDSRRNKIPPAVRQVQLNRLVEQELKRANPAVIGKNFDCDEAIARAVAREEELCKSSNSKGVYLNRCVRALACTEYEVKVEETSTPEDHGISGAGLEEFTIPANDEVVRKALEDTGLMDSPTADLDEEHDGHNRQDSQDNKDEVSDTYRGSGPMEPIENKWAENVLEVENADLNIYGDFEFSSDELGGDLSKDNSERLKHPSAAACKFSDGKAKTSSLMVVLTAGSRQPEAALESREGDGTTKKLFSKQSTEGHERASSCKGDNSRRGAEERSPPAMGVAARAAIVEASFDDADEMYDGLELNLNPVLSSEVMAQLNAESCASPPKQELRKDQEDPETLPVLDLKKRNEDGSLPRGDAPSSENMSEDDCMRFADIDRRIENIRKSKALHGDPLRSKKSKGHVHGVPNRTSGTNVQMQVEIYVNQHLKPLYRSKVITAEQFKWTVTKTAAKVMEHHGNAINADFLITEGNKVKKLADQYLQAFVHRKT